MTDSAAGIHPVINLSQADRSSRLTLLLCVAVFGLTLLCHLPLLGIAPLSGTEGHRALVADGMVRSGDWLIPRLLGRVYLRKPPLYYWMLAATQLLTGDNSELTRRIPSVLSAGVTGVVVVLFSARWFGTTASAIAGIGFLGQLAVWGQIRSAEIDQHNTLAAVVCTLATLELLIGNSKRRFLWIGIAGASFGGVLLLKGPAGLPPIIGAWLAGLWMRRRKRIEFRLTEPRLWAPPLIGLLMFGAYVLAAYLRISSLGLTRDLSGVSEAADNLVLTNLSRFFQAIALPPTVFAYALPLSLAIPIMLRSDIRAAMEDSSRTKTDAVMLSLAGAALVGLCSGMVNPRYTYIYFPLFCLVAGSAVSAWSRLDGLAAARLKIAIRACAIAFLVAQLGSTFLAFKSHMVSPIWLVLYAIIAVAAAVSCFFDFSLNSLKKYALALTVLTVSISLPNACGKVQSRFERSGYSVAHNLTDVVGADSTLLVGAVLRYQPELFLYSNVHARALGENLPDPITILEPQWIIFDDLEFPIWNQYVGSHLSNIHQFSSNRKLLTIAYFTPVTTHASWIHTMHRSAATQRSSKP